MEMAVASQWIRATPECGYAIDPTYTFTWIIPGYTFPGAQTPAAKKGSEKAKPKDAADMLAVNTRLPHHVRCVKFGDVSSKLAFLDKNAAGLAVSDWSL